MTIQLSKPFASNSAVDEFDVRQLKKVLNRLGYYRPFEKTGVTGIPDAEIFDALKDFQRDYNLPATGTVKPEDETIKRLNQLSQTEPDGFYVWRTVEDGKVRAAHAQYNRKIRAWSDAPDPGDDFNCRCWAEPVELTEEEKEALHVVHKRLKSFKEDKYTLSAKLLEHYLGKTGERIVLPEGAFDNSRIVQPSIKINQERFEKQMEEISYKLAPPSQFEDFWDVDVKKESILNSKDSDFSRAIGSAKIRSTGSFNIQKNKERTIMHGKVVHHINDVYDFNDDAIFDYLAFKNERFLAQAGYAKPFEVEWRKEQTVEGEIVFKNGILESKKFIWGK